MQKSVKNTVNEEKTIKNYKKTKIDMIKEMLFQGILTFLKNKCFLLLKVE